MEHALFPISSMWSSIIVLSDGGAIEAATIGNEGMVGVGLLINECASPYRVLQQVPGETFRIPVDPFLEILHSSRALHDSLKRYTFTLLQQSGQNAACNLRHRVETRMIRWLLQTSDRADRLEFQLTQEFLSEMLGVSRQTVNATARQLQEEGLIEYRRGFVAIKDRERMEAASCECYRLFNDTYERYMHQELDKAEEGSTSGLQAS